MTLSDANFSPIRYIEGYPLIEDHGLIGDGVTAALVGRDGAIRWLCLPRFDSPPVFCGILDKARGGAFTVAPEGLTESRQWYEPDTGILLTEMRTSGGLVRLTDALTFRDGADLSESAPAGNCELIRRVEVLQGEVRLQVEVAPRGETAAREGKAGVSLQTQSHNGLKLSLQATRPLDGVRTTVDMAEGDSLAIALRWGDDAGSSNLDAIERRLEHVADVWRRWLGCFEYEGPQMDLVRRSAITLKMLDFTENGAMVAAPTSSLPESIGGPRNWDYRYVWVRDAAFTVYALNRIGLRREAQAFLRWVLDIVEEGGRPKVLYDLDGKQPEPEWEDPDLEGYRRSPPVRWGNAAADQRQHDVFGEILDCAYQWAGHGGEIDPPLWQKLRGLVEAAAVEWLNPDHGIWEVRTPGRPFTYSAALCQVALDRGARLAERFGLEGDIERWRTDAERIRRSILKEATHPEKGYITEYLGGRTLDASLLTLPLRRLIDGDDPLMAATTEAIVQRLGAGNGLLYRYLPDESPDGLPGHEGAFLLCSFWLVDNLARQDRLDEAVELYDSLCARAGVLGLLPEQIDPPTGHFLGNYPQAFSHVGLISSGVNLARETRRRDGK